eukprot:4179590-Amphidinium_carterae.2
MKLEWPSEYGEFACGRAVFPWLVRHAASSWNWFHIKVNGRTAYEDASDQPFVHRLVPFGETVHLVHFRAPMSHTGRLLQGGARYRGDPVWHRGICFGLTENSVEDIVGTEHGILKVPRIKRLVAGQQYDRALFATSRDHPGRRSWHSWKTQERLQAVSANLAAMPLTSNPTVNSKGKGCNSTGGAKLEPSSEEMSAHKGTPRHDMKEEVSKEASGSGATTEREAAEIKNQRDLQTALADAAPLA